jgi:hypothetical protein
MHLSDSGHHHNDGFGSNAYGQVDPALRDAIIDDPVLT